jgi:hypothetical protein
MGVRLTIDVNQRLVISTFSGELSDAELLGHASLIRSHPDFDPSFSEILDFSGVTGSNLSASAVRELSRRVSIFNLTSAHVVIAPQDHIFGLARMAEVFAEKSKPNGVVVRTMDEARKILRLEKPALD